MSLFSKAEECFADVHSGYCGVKFNWQDHPGEASAALEEQRRAFDNYYHAAEAAIRAGQCGVGEGKGRL